MCTQFGSYGESEKALYKLMYSTYDKWMAARGAEQFVLADELKEQMRGIATAIGAIRECAEKAENEHANSYVNVLCKRCGKTVLAHIECEDEEIYVHCPYCDKEFNIEMVAV